MTAAFRLVIDCAEPEGLAGLGATMIAVSQEGTDNYAVAMRDPEGNEFDIK